jgi:hypothetical protein
MTAKDKKKTCRTCSKAVGRMASSQCLDCFPSSARLVLGRKEVVALSRFKRLDPPASGVPCPSAQVPQQKPGGSVSLLRFVEVLESRRYGCCEKHSQAGRWCGRQVQLSKSTARKARRSSTGGHQQQSMYGASDAAQATSECDSKSNNTRAALMAPRWNSSPRLEIADFINNNTGRRLDRMPVPIVRTMECTV